MRVQKIGGRHGEVLVGALDPPLRLGRARQDQLDAQRFKAARDDRLRALAVLHPLAEVAGVVRIDARRTAVAFQAHDDRPPVLRTVSRFTNWPNCIRLVASSCIETSTRSSGPRASSHPWIELSHCTTLGPSRRSHARRGAAARARPATSVRNRPASPVELNVLTAIALGPTFHKLLAIYLIRFLVMNYHDKETFLATMRDHLSRHDRPLAFLFGAGTSCAVPRRTPDWRHCTYTVSSANKKGRKKVVGNDPKLPKTWQTERPDVQQYASALSNWRTQSIVSTDRDDHD